MKNLFGEYFGYLVGAWLVFLLVIIFWKVIQKRGKYGKDNKSPPKLRQLVDMCKYWYRYWFSG